MFSSINGHKTQEHKPSRYQAITVIKYEVWLRLTTSWWIGRFYSLFGWLLCFGFPLLIGILIQFFWKIQRERRKRIIFWNWNQSQSNTNQTYINSTARVERLQIVILFFDNMKKLCHFFTPAQHLSVSTELVIDMQMTPLVFWTTFCERAKREFDSIIPHRENGRRSPLCCRCCCRYKDECPLSYTFTLFLLLFFFLPSLERGRRGWDGFFFPTPLIWCLTSASSDLRRESNEFDGLRLTCSCMNAVNAPSR